MKNQFIRKTFNIAAAAYTRAKNAYKGGTFANASDSAFVRDLLEEIAVAASKKKGGR